jgi:hypothetical protein
MPRQPGEERVNREQAQGNPFVEAEQSNELEETGRVPL